MAYWQSMQQQQKTLTQINHTQQNHSLLQDQNREVAKKLGTATLLMFTLPIISFYVGLYYLFPNKEEPLMWSGGLAVIFTNIVIAGYVVSAFSEDDDDFNDEPKRVGGLMQQGDGDLAGPRVGAFKQRIDWTDRWQVLRDFSIYVCSFMEMQWQ